MYDQFSKIMEFLFLQGTRELLCTVPKLCSKLQYIRRNSDLKIFFVKLTFYSQNFSTIYRV